MDWHASQLRMHQIPEAALTLRALSQVRTAEELAKVIKRRESIDVASMRVFAPVLSGDEMRGTSLSAHRKMEEGRC